MADFPQSELGYWPNWLIEGFLSERSPESQKLFLVDAYCREWISREQVAAFFAAYGLEAA